MNGGGKDQPNQKKTPHNRKKREVKNKQGGHHALQRQQVGKKGRGMKDEGCGGKINSHQIAKTYRDRGE